MAMLSMPEWKCPAWTQNASLVNTSSPVFIEVWQSRIREVRANNVVTSNGYLWRMTVCKYLNLGEATRADTEVHREIGSQQSALSDQ